MAIPTGRTPQVAAFLIPGVSLSNVDVGGTNIINTTGGSLSVHGGNLGDTRLLIDGVTIANTEGTGYSANMLPNMGSTQEVAVDYSAATAESITGGLQINMIPKTGSNRYSERCSPPPPTRRSRAAIPTRPCRPRPGDAEQLEDASRRQPRLRRPAEAGQAVVLYLGAVHQPGELRRRPVPEQERRRHHEVDLRPDTAQQAVNAANEESVNLRLTWQATPKQKLNFFYDSTGGASAASRRRPSRRSRRTRFTTRSAI